MAEAGLPLHERRIIAHIPNPDTQKSGYCQTQRLLEQSPEVTAIVASTDEMAYGAMQACRERGLAIPGDISVVGFDDYRHSAFWTPGLTTLRQPLAEFGYTAMHALDMVINGLAEELPRTVQQGELIIRGSTAPPPAKGRRP
jgi:LacI family transcriptional regulator